jgi:hypothetical protein
MISSGERAVNFFLNLQQPGLSFKILRPVQNVQWFDELTMSGSNFRSS